MTEALFVYGTLMDPVVQQRVFGRTVPGETDSLDGYKKDLIYLGSRIYPIARPAAGNSVAGWVIQVTWVELGLIDHY